MNEAIGKGCKNDPCNEGEEGVKKKNLQNLICHKKLAEIQVEGELEDDVSNDDRRESIDHELEEGWFHG